MCLTEFAGKGDLVNMSKVQMLLSLKKQRLTTEEIFALFEQTIAELEEELSLSKEENKMSDSNEEEDTYSFSSCLSLKSDRSKGIPIFFSNEPGPSETN